MDLVVPADHSDNEIKRKEIQIFGSCHQAEIAMEHEGDDDTNCS